MAEEEEEEEEERRRRSGEEEKRAEKEKREEEERREGKREEQRKDGKTLTMEEKRWGEEVTRREEQQKRKTFEEKQTRKSKRKRNESMKPQIGRKRKKDREAFLSLPHLVLPSDHCGRSDSSLVQRSLEATIDSHRIEKVHIVTSLAKSRKKRKHWGSRREGEENQKQKRSGRSEVKIVRRETTRETEKKQKQK